jgi:hypothetical protein
MCQLLFTCLFLFFTVVGQEVRTPVTQIQVAEADRVVRLAANVGGLGRVIVTRTAGPLNIASGDTLRVTLQRLDSPAIEMSAPAALPDPIAVFGVNLVYGSAKGGSQVLDLVTGRSKSIGADFRSTTWLAWQGKLVGVGTILGTSQSVLRVYEPNLETYSDTQLPIPIRALVGPFLSISAAGTLIWIDPVEASYRQVNPGSSAPLGPVVSLVGSEVEESRRRPLSVSGGAKFRKWLLHAHFAADGSDVFSFVPSARREGYRIGVFDSQGLQIRSLRLLSSPDIVNGNSPVSFAKENIVTQPGSIGIVTAGGRMQSYLWP